MDWVEIDAGNGELAYECAECDAKVYPLYTLEILEGDSLSFYDDNSDPFESRAEALAAAPALLRLWSDADDPPKLGKLITSGAGFEEYSISDSDSDTLVLSVNWVGDFLGGRCVRVDELGRGSHDLV